MSFQQWTLKIEHTYDERHRVINSTEGFAKRVVVRCPPRDLRTLAEAFEKGGFLKARLEQLESHLPRAARSCEVWIHFSPGNQPAMSAAGYHVLLKAFDERGNPILDLTADTALAPCHTRLEFARITRQFDALDRQTGEQYWVVARNGKFALIRRMPLAGGRGEESSFWTESGAKAIHQEGYHLVRRFADEHRNVLSRALFDLEGNPTTHPSGYHRLDARYAGPNRCTEIVYRDARGLPALGPERAHHLKSRYDANGNLLETVYLGTDGRPVLCNLGHARLTIQRGPDGKAYPVYWDLSASGEYLRFVQKWNDRRQVIEESFFREDGRPGVHRNGYHRRALKYTAEGVMNEEAFFGADNTPALFQDTYTRRVWYFRGGQVIDDQAFDSEGRRLPIEVIVKAVTPGSTSAQSGLRAGDRLLRLDGQPIRNVPHLVELYRMGYRDGRAFRVSVLRDGKELELSGYPIPPEVELDHRVGRLK
jgi:hypothetical protein